MDKKPLQGQLEIECAPWATHKNVLQSIRKKVFVEEQQIAVADEWDSADEASSTCHFIAKQNEQTIGTARLVKTKENEFKLTRIAVLGAFRRRGIATRLIQQACFTALSEPCEKLYLHAQVGVDQLYLGLGFEREGERFNEAGIAHQKMVLPLASHDVFEHLFQSVVWRVNYASEFLHHSVNMINAGSRSLLISSQQLRDDIFTELAFVDAISAFARRDRRTHIHILVHRSHQLSRHSQKLVELARRLPTKITIKTLSEDEPQELPSFICCDQRRLVFFNDEANLQGFCCYNAAAEVKSLTEDFNYAWNHLAKPDPNMNQLFI